LKKRSVRFFPEKEYSMATAVIMPKAGMSMETGTIIAWIKKVGDPVQIGEALVEIETDKVAMEVEAETAGVLLSILHGPGDLVPVTQTIGYIGSAAELKNGFAAEPVAAMVGKPAAEPNGTSVADGRPAPHPEKSGGKVPMTPAARARARELGLDPALLQPSGPQGELRLRDVPEAGGGVKASSLARKIAARESIDLASLAGSGPGGRIVKQDLEQARTTPPSTASTLKPGSADGDLLPLSRTRRIIAERLSQSMFTAPHYYLRLAIPAENLVTARNSTSDANGKKVSLNAFIIKYAAEALKKYPLVNASWQGDSIRLFKTIDIGLAVAQDDGLITPVVRDCGSKGLLRIEAELQELIRRAKTGKLLPDEFTNATFTISNLGSFGIDEFTAVINPPGSAILAVGSLKKEAVVNDSGDLVARTLLRTTLSCDHRVIDGAIGAGFLKYLGDIIEHPYKAFF